MTETREHQRRPQRRLSARIDPGVGERLDALAAHLGLPKTSVLEIAVLELADRTLPREASSASA